MTTQLINDLVTKNYRFFSNALQQNKTQYPANKINFPQDLLEVLIKSELENRLNFYENYKKSSFSNNDTNLPFINTPHPIGNLSATHGILLDFIARINNVEIRINLQKDNPKYADDKIAVYKEKQLNNFKEKILREKLVSKEELNDSNNLDGLLNILANKFVQEGLDVKVINAQQQTQDAQRKIDHLKSNNRTAIDKNWNRVDGDGDPDNSMNNVLGEAIFGRRLDEIYAISRNLETKDVHELAYEPRISCKEGKKGVNGAIIALNEIEGVNEVSSIDDLLNEKSFAAKYQNFENFLKKVTYDEKNSINTPLDIILRATLPNFINANGLVLSDFPDDEKEGEELLARLLFVKQATEKFFKEILKGNFEAKDQKFLPLCENEDAINNLKNLVEKILDKVTKKAQEVFNHKQSINDKAAQLLFLKKQFSNSKDLVFGAFFGPSDLTADMGGFSIAVINNKKCELAQIYAQFQENIRPFANFDDINLVQEYGKGSSHNRGANLAFNSPRTIQGQSLSSTDLNLQKTYSRHSGGQESIVKIPAEILAQAVRNHRYFLNKEGDLGKIPLNHNRILESDLGQILMMPTTKDFANSQGTRGKTGLVNFEDKRAIGMATLRNYFGLLQAPLMPYDFQKGEMMKWEKESFQEFVNHPAGLVCLMNELTQFCIFDSKRAAMLEFDEALIKECRGYVISTLKFLDKTLDLNLGLENKIDLTQSASLKTLIEDSVNQVVTKLKASDSNVIKSPYLKERLDLFEKQIPIISNISENLTSKVENIWNQSGKISLPKQEESKEEVQNNDLLQQDYACVGTYLNMLSNFQLPVVASQDPFFDKEKKICEEKGGGDFELGDSLSRLKSPRTSISNVQANKNFTKQSSCVVL